MAFVFLLRIPLVSMSDRTLRRKILRQSLLTFFFLSRVPFWLVSVIDPLVMVIFSLNSGV